MSCANWLPLSLILLAGCSSQQPQPAWQSPVIPVSEWKLQAHPERGRTYNRGNHRQHLTFLRSGIVDTLTGPKIEFAFSPFVVIGTVRDRQTYLSEDSLGLYTEWTIQLDSVWSQLDPPRLKPGLTIAVNRVGGSLRMPSGNVQTSTVSGIEEPLGPQGRYLLFLRYDHEADWYDLDKAWEVRDGRMVPLDPWDRQSTFAGKPLDVFHRALQARDKEFISYSSKRG